MANNCIWAILSIGELGFVNTSSIYDSQLLKGRSLYQLIHPEEVALAKRDLSIFMNSNMIGGSVTRCRLKDYTTVNTNSWIVVDIIMYIATKDLVLAFFHHQPQQRQATCGSHLVQPESRNIISLLKDSLIRSPSLSPTNTSSTSNSPVAEEDGFPNQYLHILDNHSKSVLLSWPYPNEELLLSLDNRPMSPTTISCFHCVQQPARTTLLGEKVHQIMIGYGSITFVLVYIEKSRKMQLSPPVSSSSCSSDKRSTSPYLLPVNDSHKQQQYPYHQRNQCHSCGTDSSPEWRRGPTGHKTLCNACGLRYSRSIARQGKNNHSLKKHYKQSIQFAIS